MDNATRHAHIAQRFLVSLLQRYGPDAPMVLQQWADELEALEAEMKTAGQRVRPAVVHRGECGYEHGGRRFRAKST